MWSAQHIACFSLRQARTVLRHTDLSSGVDEISVNQSINLEINCRT